MLHVRNTQTGKLAHVVDQGRHRVTVRLMDGSHDEWLLEETDFDGGSSCPAPAASRTPVTDPDSADCTDSVPATSTQTYSGRKKH